MFVCTQDCNDCPFPGSAIFLVSMAGSSPKSNSCSPITALTLAVLGIDWRIERGVGPPPQISLFADAHDVHEMQFIPFCFCGAQLMTNHVNQNRKADDVSRKDQSRLTSAGTVQGFNARNFVSGDSHAANPVGCERNGPRQRPTHVLSPLRDWLGFSKKSFWFRLASLYAPSQPNGLFQTRQH